MFKTILATASCVGLLTLTSVPVTVFAQDDSAQPPAAGQLSQEERAARRQQIRENAANLSDAERQAIRESRRQRIEARRENGNRPIRRPNGQRPTRQQADGANSSSDE